MAVYNPKTHEDALSLDEVELFKDLYEQFRFYRPLDPSHLHVLFRHIVLGMDAGYYSYVW
jgi:Zn-dependent oligopeptidase